jgi:Tfp pilus assembly major pilin PilA
LVVALVEVVVVVMVVVVVVLVLVLVENTIATATATTTPTAIATTNNTTTMRQLDLAPEALMPSHMTEIQVINKSEQQQADFNRAMASEFHGVHGFT